MHLPTKEWKIKHGIILEYEASKLSIIFLIGVKHAVDNRTPGQVKKQVTKSTMLSSINFILYIYIHI